MGALLFTPIGGVITQVAVSSLSYAGVAVASIFDQNIRNDMNLIGWDPFNTDETKVVNSNKVSFYKGVPVFLTKDLPGSLSFGFILLNTQTGGRKTYYGKGVTHEDVLKHEYGHNIQLNNMGVGKYIFFVAIPSPIKNSNTSPWELSASLLGGSRLGSTVGNDIATGEEKNIAMKYYNNALSYNPQSWWENINYFLIA